MANKEERDLQKEEIAQETIIADEPKVTLAEKLKEKKKAANKKRNKRIAIGAGVLLVSFLIWNLFKPYKASAEYGICHSLLELQIPYPHTLHVSQLKFKRTGAMVLWSTFIDAFGEFRMEPFTCHIQYNPETGLPVVTELRMGKIPINSERLAFLNNAIPYFVENPLVLDYPYPLADNLVNLQVQSDLYYNIQLNLRWQ
ncbi:MAG: hypothetical protein ACLFP8_03145 [Alphaproteobacteria bacterium]